MTVVEHHRFLSKCYHPRLIYEKYSTKLNISFLIIATYLTYDFMTAGKPTQRVPYLEYNVYTLKLFYFLFRPKLNRIQITQ